MDLKKLQFCFYLLAFVPFLYFSLSRFSAPEK